MLPHVNAAAMQLLLDRFAATIAEGEHLVRVL
jgi:hypothetical protein